MSEAPVYVAVCGGSDVGEDETALAEEVGRLLARADAVVVCGGLTGVMAAVARGVADEGGVSIGVLPGLGREDQAPDLTYSIPTGMGEARNAVVVSAADALIAIAGEYGTLSEIGLALRLGVPVVGLRTWGLVRAGAPVEAFPNAGSAEEAVKIALESARTRADRP
ncbi:MAG: LOG family protein [Actinomycetota bacterium]